LARSRHFCVAVLALWSTAALAQDGPRAISDERRAGRLNATRRELEQIAATAEAAVASNVVDKRLEAAAIRERLRTGDFVAGDRIVLTMRSDSVVTDTLVVRSGRTVSIASLHEEIPLEGVLRAELQPLLQSRMSRLFKQVIVEVTPLIRFGVLGEVIRPGFYRVPFDIPITDAIMMAGGPTTRADLGRSTAKRGAAELMSKSELRQAFVAGTTLAQLNLLAGDELIVGAKSERNWPAIASIVTVVTGIVLSLRRF
jgi:protein involved in polysaccharide export with SLBB domain